MSSSSSHSRSSNTPDTIASAQVDHPILLAVTLGVIFLAMIRCLVVVFPELYWDVDPRSSMAAELGSVLGIGPVGAIVLDTLSVAMAGMAMIVHGRLGGRLSWPVVVLAGIGVVINGWHLFQHVPGMMHHGSWIAAMALAVAMYHLTQHGLPARWLAVSMVGLLWPFLLRSLLYVFWEHPMTLEMFRKHEEQNIIARGWQVGSSQHLLYVRRLEFPDVTGAFGLSNIFGSVTAGLTIASAALAAGLIIRRRWNLMWIPAVSFLAGAIVLYYTHAKGPILAGSIGGGLLLLALLSTKWKLVKPMLAPLALAGVVMASGLVIARGMMGPPDSEAGERSLLFRDHYWQASAKILTHEPWHVRLLGVGAGRYKDYYSLYKNPLNPEEVTSAHNVFVDWFAMLGLVGGLAWSGLIVGWLWQAGRGLVHQSADEPLAAGEERLSLQEVINVRFNTVGALLLGAALFGVYFYSQGITLLSPESFLVAGLSVALFIGTTAVLVHAQVTTRWAVMLALFLAASVLLIHAQVEMTFYNMQAAPLVFCIVAAAAGVSVRAKPAVVSEHLTSSLQPRVAPAVAGGALFVAALVMVVLYIAPVGRQQSALKQAAESLRKQRIQDTYNELDQAIKALPRDPRPYVSKVMLMMEHASYLAHQNNHTHAQYLVTNAMSTLDQAHAAGLRDVSLLRCRAQVTELAGHLFNDAGRMNDAVILWQQVMLRTPQNLTDALKVADLLWRLGRHDEAHQAYERVLQIHRDSYLDSARQLSPDDLSRVEARIQPAEN